MRTGVHCQQTARQNGVDVVFRAWGQWLLVVRLVWVHLIVDWRTGNVITDNLIDMPPAQLRGIAAGSMVCFCCRSKETACERSRREPSHGVGRDSWLPNCRPKERLSRNNCRLSQPEMTLHITTLCPSHIYLLLLLILHDFR